MKINKPFISEEENQKYKTFFNDYIIKDINQMLESNNTDIKHLLEMFCASLMIELNKKFPEPNYSIYMTYRIKSSKSKIDKLEDYIKRLSVSDGKVSIKDFTDLIGMRVIIEKIPHNVNISKDTPNYNELIELKNERKKNINLSEEYHDFYSSIENNECSKFDYYKKSKELITSILGMLDDKKSSTYATELKGTYNQLLKFCTDNINMLELIGDYSSIINMENAGVDFSKLLDDFDSRIDSKLALELYSSTFSNIFEKSELLNSLGAKISDNDERTKYKREPSGFVSDFKGINFDGFPLNFELQLMTVNEHLSSVLGYSAHSNMPDKNPIRCELPPAYRNRMINLLHNSSNLESLGYEHLSLIRKVLKVKKLSKDEVSFVSNLLDNVHSKGISNIQLDEESSKQIKNLFILNNEQEAEIGHLLYNEGITNFNSWAENISAFHATVRLDKESSTKNRVKIDYDDPYESLSHVLRQQIEGYNINGYEANLSEQYLSRIYTNQDSWLKISPKSSTSIIEYEIKKYIENDLKILKENYEIKENEIADF